MTEIRLFEDARNYRLKGGVLVHEIRKSEDVVCTEIIGESVGMPFVIIRYRGADGRIIRAEISLEDIGAQRMRDVAQLLERINDGIDRLTKVPLIGRMTKRILCVSAAVRYRPIPESGL